MRPRRLVAASGRPLNFTVRHRVRDWIRNSLIGVIIFVLATVTRLYLGPYWSKAFLLDRTFGSRWALPPALLAAFWGWDFLVAMIGGFAFLLLIRAQRPLLWVSALGLAFLPLKVRYFRYWISPEADWTPYVEDYGVYVMPLIGALSGGYLAQLARAMQRSGRGA